MCVCVCVCQAVADDTELRSDWEAGGESWWLCCCCVISEWDQAEVTHCSSTLQSDHTINNTDLWEGTQRHYYIIMETECVSCCPSDEQVFNSKLISCFTFQRWFLCRFKEKYIFRTFTLKCFWSDNSHWEHLQWINLEISDVSVCIMHV